MLGGPDAPVITGSIDEPVEVERPLPRTLAFSDASKIGQAARAALWQADSGEPEEWVNIRTGSSGTLKADNRSARSADCRPFSTTVTSLAGVHQYSGSLCRADATRTLLKIAEGSGEDSS